MDWFERRYSKEWYSENSVFGVYKVDILEVSKRFYIISNVIWVLTYFTNDLRFQYSCPLLTGHLLPCYHTSGDLHTLTAIFNLLIGWLSFFCFRLNPHIYVANDEKCWRMHNSSRFPSVKAIFAKRHTSAWKLSIFV